MPREGFGLLNAPGRDEGLADSVSACIEELGRIGAGAGEGVTRVAWSPELFDAYGRVSGWMRDLGLEVEIDAAGNLLGRWQTGTGNAVLLGSHLDTVPSGGQFDGVLGVVAAVHVAALLKREGLEPRRPLWIAAFMDEEGTRFDTALFGSRAFAGEDVVSLGERTDAAGVSLRDAMQAAGFDLDRVPEARRIEDVQAYLELHIEQGPVLEADGLELGIVTSVLGLRGYRVRLHGQANHAGATPMPLRRDALIGAARVALCLRDAVRQRAGTTANVGRLRIAPGGANVVPGFADFTIDVRASSAADLAWLSGLVETTVRRVADEESLEVELEQTFALEPLEFDPELVRLIERTAHREGAAAKRLPSGGGHDAMVIGRHVPAAMVFVPSRDGISHSPQELSDPEHAERATRLLAATVRDLLEAE